MNIKNCTLWDSEIMQNIFEFTLVEFYLPNKECLTLDIEYLNNRRGHTFREYVPYGYSVRGGNYIKFFMPCLREKPVNPLISPSLVGHIFLHEYLHFMGRGHEQMTDFENVWTGFNRMFFLNDIFKLEYDGKELDWSLSKAVGFLRRLLVKAGIGRMEDNFPKYPLQDNISPLTDWTKEYDLLMSHVYNPDVKAKLHIGGS